MKEKPATLPTCQHVIRSSEFGKAGKRCTKPARPVNGVIMKCEDGHRFVGIPEEYEQAKLAGYSY